MPRHPAALAGLLAGRRATTNKAAWSWVTGVAPAGASDNNITWVPSARWTVDGRICTSSSVAAGIDMMYALALEAYGPAVADAAINLIEYALHQDPAWDPVSVVHKVPGADGSRSLTSCVAPAGF
ncbi:hypothetical protein PG994_002473 [Apiospora phragmitis]|uniref:Uncharacterized protein n=1 Tax=Apiospora phragmitis TaxID=2905665 RepID=A0ABR1WWK8_9PEZI